VHHATKVCDFHLSNINQLNVSPAVAISLFLVTWQFQMTFLLSFFLLSYLVTPAQKFNVSSTKDCLVGAALTCSGSFSKQARAKTLIVKNPAQASIDERCWPLVTLETEYKNKYHEMELNIPIT